MLKLIQTEFIKMRRRKFAFLMLLSALFMPFLAVFYFKSTQGATIDSVQFYKWAAFSYTPWIILPVVLGLFSTLLMYEENQNDMLKQLWILPISKVGYFFSKFFIVLVYSICFMLITAIASIICGMFTNYIFFEWRSVGFLLRKCIEIGILTATAVLPLLATAVIGKSYILPVCVTLVYTFLGFILMMVNMYLHPLSSISAILMRDIPGAVLTQALNVPAGLLCIAFWCIVSTILAILVLKNRE